MAKTRWDLGGKDLERLVREAKEYKGESLWQDAWRRLKASRAAWWSLVFLSLFGLTSLLAPLLPIPSPTAFTRTGRPQVPGWWPRDKQPEEVERALAKLPKGTRPSSALLFGAFNDGWRHRTVVSVEVDRGAPEATERSLAKTLRHLSGRRVTAEREELENQDRSVLHLALPNRKSDGGEADYQDTGRAGVVHVLHAPKRAGEEEGGTRRAYYECELPVDPQAVRDWSVQSVRREHSLFLTTDAGEYRFQFRHPADLAWEVIGVSINGQELPAQQVAGADASSTPALQDGDPWRVRDLRVLAAELDATRAAQGSVEPNGERADLRVEAQFVDPGRPWLERAQGAVSARFRFGHEPPLFERRAHHAREARRMATLDLGQRLQAAYAERDARPVGSLPGVPTVLATRSEDGYGWEVSALDRWLLGVRGKLFGLWQTGNWMGTDAGGRDLLARIVWGSRTSIQVALAAAFCSLLIGVTYGAFSGLVGGRVDNLMMRFVDILYSVPFIFVVIFLITIVGEYRGLLEDRYGIDREVVFFFVIGAIYWLTMARVVRGQVLSLKNSEFIEAARVVGASTSRILFVHLVPNVLSIVIVYLTLTIPAVMLFEAFLSFLGLGIEPPKVSWGLLASDSTEAITPIRTFWWIVVFPAGAMGSTLLALNIVGDGLRDALDPKLRGKD